MEQSKIIDTLETYHCPNQRRLCLVLLPPVAGCDAAEASPPPSTPTASPAIPLLTHTPCYSAATAASHRSRTSEPSYSSTRGHPLPRLPRLRIVPFLGLAVIHRLGALGRHGQHGQGTASIGRGLYVERPTAGSTAARKEMPPYYAQNNDSST